MAFEIEVLKTPSHTVASPKSRPLSSLGFLNRPQAAAGKLGQHCTIYHNTIIPPNVICHL